MSREQSIAFLRRLKASPAGETIYQEVIDDVLGALDETEARAERAEQELANMSAAWRDALKREAALRAELERAAEDVMRLQGELSESRAELADWEAKYALERKQLDERTTEAAGLASELARDQAVIQDNGREIVRLGWELARNDAASKRLLASNERMARALINIGAICNNTHVDEPVSDMAAIAAIEDELDRAEAALAPAAPSASEPKTSEYKEAENANPPARSDKPGVDQGERGSETALPPARRRRK